jgi:hypothetical protein
MFSSEHVTELLARRRRVNMAAEPELAEVAIEEAAPLGMVWPSGVEDDRNMWPDVVVVDGLSLNNGSGRGWSLVAPWSGPSRIPTEHKEEDEKVEP